MGSYVNFYNGKGIWKVFDERIAKIANTYEDVTVIADSPCDTNELRKESERRHPEFDRHILMLFSCSFKDLLINNKKRIKQKVLSDKKLKQLYNKFEQTDLETLEYFSDYMRIIGNF